MENDLTIRLSTMALTSWNSFDFSPEYQSNSDLFDLCDDHFSKIIDNVLHIDIIDICYFS